MKTSLKAICARFERIFCLNTSVGRKEFTKIPLDAKPSGVYNNSRLYRTCLVKGKYSVLQSKRFGETN